MKHFVLTALCAALLLPAFAQFPMGGGAPGGNRGAQGGGQANIGHFYGRIVDTKTNKGIEGASVELFNNKFDPKTKNIFLTAAEYDEKPATEPGKRPQRIMKPDTFMVLVVSK